MTEITARLSATVRFAVGSLIMDVKPSAALLVALLTLAVVAPLLAHPGSGLVVDRQGRVYFVLPGDSRIMRIDGAGNLTTFVSDPRLRLPHHLVMDAAGNIFVASDHDGIIWKITPAGELTEFFSSQDLWRARVAIVGNVGDPFTMDAAGNIYCLNLRRTGDQRGTSRILKVRQHQAGTSRAGAWRTRVSSGR